MKSVFPKLPANKSPIYTAVAMWMMFIVYVILWFEVDYNYLIDIGAANFFYAGLPVLTGIICFVAAVIMAVSSILRKQFIVSGLISGFSTAAAGAGFWFMFYLFVIWA